MASESVIQGSQHPFQLSWLADLWDRVLPGAAVQVQAQNVHLLTLKPGTNVMLCLSTEWTCSEILVTQVFLLRVRHEYSVSSDLKRGPDLLTSRCWLSSDCCAVSIGMK